MNLNFLDGLEFDQIGIVVKDIEVAINQFRQLFGIDNVKIIHYPNKNKMSSVFYKEEPADFSIKVAFKKIGGIEFELIQPVEGDSIYEDFLRNRGQGVHHIRFSLDEKNYEIVHQKMIENGFECVARGQGVRSKSKWMVYATEKQIGVDVELKVFQS